MNFDLYRRYDLHMVVVPSSLPKPARLSQEGELHRVGSANVAFDSVSHALAQAIALQGYGIADEGTKR